MFSGRAKIGDFIVIAVSTFFYIGYLPLIPGTFGSIAGISLFYLLGGAPLCAAILVSLLAAAGFLTAGRAERIMHRKDPACIVIDEACGMLLSLLFVPYEPRLAVLAFLLFRILDALKPYPAGPLQRLSGAAGIMSDDIIAGLYTNIILQIVSRLS